ncbi:uncharacterized protein PG986_014895 [Apiospora aurea]|uniref:Uncharacterized protein n=1 Tax=Apiospora aurea TaxID=335848 RepID=A0ABR1PU99_9PEZI
MARPRTSVVGKGSRGFQETLRTTNQSIVKISDLTAVFRRKQNGSHASRNPTKNVYSAKG